MADEAIAAAPQPTPAADNAAPIGKVYQQAEVDRITESVRANTEAKIRKEVQEAAERERMTEVEKLRADNEAEKKRGAELESRLSRVEQERKVAAASSSFGYVPDKYIADAIARADTDAKPEAIAKAAFDEFTADAARLKGNEARPKETTPRTGPLPDNANDLASMDDAQLHRLAIVKGAKFYNEVVKPEWDRRRRSAAGKA